MKKARPTPRAKLKTEFGGLSDKRRYSGPDSSGVRCSCYSLRVEVVEGCWAAMAGCLERLEKIKAPRKLRRCPLCGKRFYQDAKDLLEIGSQMQSLVFGRPLRSVEVDYDCPHCSNRGIFVALLHTDLSWGELYKEHMQTAVCRNGLCPHKGLRQSLKPSRVVL